MTITREASADDASMTLGTSFELMTSLVGSRIVNVSPNFFSIGCESSPESDDIRSTIALRSARSLSRRSAMTPTFLWRSGHKPKRDPRSSSRRLPTFAFPRRAVSTRRMVPLPDRFSPKIMRIFCSDVSVVRRYPNHCRSARILAFAALFAFFDFCRSRFL